MQLFEYAANMKKNLTKMERKCKWEECNIKVQLSPILY